MRTSPGWLVAAMVPLLCLLPVLWFVVRGEPRNRLVAQNLAQLLTGFVLLLTAQGFGRSTYLDLALVLAILAPAGTLVYARFLGGLPPAPLVRWTAVVGVPATVLPLCVVSGAGRETVKLLFIGAVLLAGAWVTSSGSQPSSEPEPDGTDGPSGSEPSSGERAATRD